MSNAVLHEVPFLSCGGSLFSLVSTLGLSISLKALSMLQNKTSNSFGKEAQAFHFYLFLTVNLILKYRIMSNALFIENVSYNWNSFSRSRTNSLHYIEPVIKAGTKTWEEFVHIILQKRNSKTCVIPQMSSAINISIMAMTIIH